MPRKRSTYTAEFKLAAVKMTTDQKLSVAEVARRLDVGENLLRTWKKAFEERGDEGLDPLDVVGGLLARAQDPLGRRLRVPDLTGRPPDEADHPVPGLLEAPQDDELDEVAEVQRRGRGVEAAVERERTCGERIAQGCVQRLGHARGCHYSSSCSARSCARCSTSCAVGAE